MAQFVLICDDFPDSLELRLATRPSHLDYLKTVAGQVMLGGPMLNAEGKPVGSLIVIEAADAAAAKAFSDADPYVKAGLFAKVDIRPFSRVGGILS